MCAAYSRNIHFAQKPTGSHQVMHQSSLRAKFLREGSESLTAMFPIDYINCVWITSILAPKMCSFKTTALTLSSSPTRFIPKGNVPFKTSRTARGPYAMKQEDKRKHSRRSHRLGRALPVEVCTGSASTN